MVGAIFLHVRSINIVQNESAHENMKEIIIFSHRVQGKHQNFEHRNGGS